MGVSCPDAERMTVAVETDSMRTIAEGITERLRGSRIEALHFDDRTGYMAISLDNGLWLLISVDWGGYSIVLERSTEAQQFWAGGRYGSSNTRK